MAYAHLVKPGSKCRLDKIDPNDTGGIDKEAALKRLEELGKEIGELQELMFAARRTALLVVFQGRDSAGKDGAINRILSYVNVQSCRVAYFKVPTPDEYAHDFLWRIHQHAPALGGMTVFNRSHYEDVVAARVHKIVPKSVWSRRYDHINAFESALLDAETVVLKFFLHIDADEQKERLLAREKNPEKAWKLAVADWRERDFWDETTHAYEEAISRCSTERAPWRVIPANKKWFRDLAVAEAMVEALRPHRKGWLRSLEDWGRKQQAELAAFRLEHGMD